MVVRDFDVFRITVAPYEADAKLVIYSDRVLASAIVFEGLESKAWPLELRQRRCRVEENELS